MSPHKQKPSLTGMDGKEKARLIVSLRSISSAAALGAMAAQADAPNRLATELSSIEQHLVIVKDILEAAYVPMREMPRPE